MDDRGVALLVGHHMALGMVLDMVLAITLAMALGLVQEAGPQLVAVPAATPSLR